MADSVLNIAKKIPKNAKLWAIYSWFCQADRGHVARIPRASDRIATIEETVKLAVVDRCRDLLENRIVQMGRIGPNDG